MQFRVGAIPAALGSFDLPPIVVVFFSALVDVVVAWLDLRLRRPGPST